MNGISKNQLAFSGKLKVVTEGLEHAITKKVRDVVKAAPKGTELYVSEGYAPHIGKIGFCTPESGDKFISGAYGLKSSITEQDLLNSVREGRRKMKQGTTTGWISGT